MGVEEASSSSSSPWSWEEDKLFENALVDYPERCSHRWERIAAAVPGKSVEDIRHHYYLLVEDVKAIEAGLVALPNYTSNSEGSDHRGGSKKGGGNSRAESSRSKEERRKGLAWTEDEHRLFLAGLEKYGKGDWRSISRNFVVTRTPTQVASHAQKFFIRQSSMNKDRRRTSIHDITSVGAGDMSAPQGPIAGQMSGQTALKSVKQSFQPPVGPLGVGMYGTTIGQPVHGPLVSAVGTPVNLPHPASPHMAYGIRSPVPGTMVPGAPVHLPPMNYHHMPPPRAFSAQR